MNLRPFEACIIRRLLAGEGAFGTAPADPMADLEFFTRLNEEAPPIGAHVFRLVCKLGGDATKEMAANQRQRKKLRTELKVARLPAHTGPERAKPVYAPTMNEYAVLDKWKKGECCDALDREIADLRKAWPEWSCGSTDLMVAPKAGKTVKCKPCKGSGGIDRKRKNGPSVRTPCADCGGTGRAGAPPTPTREGGRKRIVFVTRESSKRPDELALDTIGGKAPLDRLVQAGVLRGDTSEWLARYCDWKPAAPGEGKVTIDVYEVGTD